MTHGGHGPRSRRDGTYDVTCWCEANVVHVPMSDILEGVTKSCDGGEYCKRGCVPRMSADRPDRKYSKRRKD